MNSIRRQENLVFANPNTELSSLTRLCVAGRRFGDLATLRRETAAWSQDVNGTQRGVDWQMKIDDARAKLISIYPKIIV
ncbi:MAG: hypothetical protein U0836_17575 [Pirellulales bacterium]